MAPRESLCDRPVGRPREAPKPIPAAAPVDTDDIGKALVKTRVRLPEIRFEWLMEAQKIQERLLLSPRPSHVGQTSLKTPQNASAGRLSTLCNICLSRLEDLMPGPHKRATIFSSSIFNNSTRLSCAAWHPRFKAGLVGVTTSLPHRTPFVLAPPSGATGPAAQVAAAGAIVSRYPSGNPRRVGHLALSVLLTEGEMAGGIPTPGGRSSLTFTFA